MEQNIFLAYDAKSAIPQNLRVITPDSLPVEILRQLTPLQQQGLVFASKGYEVLDAQVKTSPGGSKANGTVNRAGSTSVTQEKWNASWRSGTANQNRARSLGAVINLSVEDIQTGERSSLNFTLPYSLSAPIVAGDIVTIFYVNGGLPNPMVKGDFKLVKWTPFAARDSSTRQVIPLSSIPTLSKPLGAGLLTAGMFFDGVGLLLLFGGLTLNTAYAGRGAELFFSLFSFALSALPFLYRSSIRRRWKDNFEEARKFAFNVKRLSGMSRVRSRKNGKTESGLHSSGAPSNSGTRSRNPIHFILRVTSDFLGPS